MTGTKEPLAVSIVGCGVIASQYVERLQHRDEIRLVGAFDALPERARGFCDARGLRCFASVDELLEDEQSEAVLNLTPAAAHAGVNEAILAAGKHAFSEKPIALTSPEAQRLATLARDAGLRLGAAPVTYMGEAQQTAWRLIREGACGRVHLVYADLNFGALESWHPAPQHLFDVGPVFDIGVYPLTLATAFFGPAVRARAIGRIIEPSRTTLGGERFSVTTPDWVLAIIELASGVLLRLTVTFALENSHQRGIEFHGDRGVVFLASHQFFDADVAVAEPGGTFRAVPLVREPAKGIDWSRGILDLADAIRNDRPHRASAEHGAHVVEVMEAIMRSTTEDGDWFHVSSRFEPPEPELWAR